MIRGLALGLMLTACSGLDPLPTQPLSDGRYVMGTVLEITLPSGDPQQLDALYDTAEELEHLFTRFDPNSAVERLNRTAGEGPQSVPPELADLLGHSLRFSRLTRGRFDVTVGPLIELWIQAGRNRQLPNPHAFARARRRVGFQKVLVDSDRSLAELPRSGMRVDLGGIAKGYALDRLTAELVEQRVRNALFDFGGSSIHALGNSSDGPGWRVLIRDAEDGFAGVATLRDQALSVSASLGQGFEIEGRRYGHILDPTTGQPLNRQRAVAVVADSGALAEALSKALLILEAEEALALIDELPEAEALIMHVDGRQWLSRGWDSATRYSLIERIHQSEDL